MFLIFLGLLANLFFEYPCTTHATQLRHARRGPHLFAQRQIKRWLCFYMATNDMQLNRTRTSISGLSSASQSIQMVTCHQQDSHSTSQTFPNYSTPRKSCGHGLDRLTISGWKPAYVMHRLTESVLQILSTMWLLWLPVVSMLRECCALTSHHVSKVQQPLAEATVRNGSRPRIPGPMCAFWQKSNNDKLTASRTQGWINLQTPKVLRMAK